MINEYIYGLLYSYIFIVNQFMENSNWNENNINGQ